MPSIRLFSLNKDDIKLFLQEFYQNNKDLQNSDQINFANPIEIADIIAAIIDNNDKYDIAAWLNLDDEVYIKVTENNLNDIIKYLYERYPY